MTVGDKIKQLRLQVGMTQEELGLKIGVQKGAINKYESGVVVNIKRERLNMIAKTLGTTPSYLLGWDERYDIEKTKMEVGKIEKGIRIPVLGKVAAGIPIEAIENYYSDEWEEIPEDMANGADYFALKIQGTSMEPKFSEGDVVIVRKQSDVESGDVVVVIIDGSDATIKKIMKQDNGILLVALNQSVFPPMFYDNATIANLPIKILGKVVELRAKF